MLEHYGAHLGLRNARKHIGWYLEKSGRADRQRQGLAPAAVHRRKMPARVLRGLAAFYADAQEVAA